MSVRMKPVDQRAVTPLSLQQHEEALKKFTASQADTAAKEKYMKENGLIYVDGVLHWEKTNLPRGFSTVAEFEKYQQAQTAAETTVTA